MPRKNHIDSIAKHVAILNDEVGRLQVDVASIKSSIKMFKWIFGYIAILLTGLVGKLII